MLGYAYNERKQLLVGTRNSGVVHLDFGNSYTNIANMNHVFKGLYVRDFVQKDSVFFVATVKGLRAIVQKGKSTFRVINLTNCFTQQKFNDKEFNSLLLTDNGSKLWIGSNINGLLKVDVDSLLLNNKVAPVVFNTENKKLRRDKIYDLYEDASGKIWIATVGEGLHKLDPKTDSVAYYNEKHGLTSDIVCKILEDNQKRLWISTTNGIFKQVVDSSGNDSFRQYSKEDGLHSNRFYEASGYKDNTGILYFGGNKGITSFRPEHIHDNEFKPPIHFKYIKVQNKNTEKNRDIFYAGIPETHDRKQITLNHTDYLLSLKFAGLSFSNAHRNLYSYKLENFDKTWNVVTSEYRAVYYSTLPAGDYIFKVKASNSDGVWNNETTELHIHVLPPWWQTWGFRIGAILIISLIAALFFRQRVQALKKRQRLLEQKVDERTKELTTANVELQERQEEIIAQNEEIQQQSEELASQRDNIVEQKQQIEQSLKRLEVLSEFGQKLTATLNVEGIHNLLYNYIQSVMNINAFGIGLVAEERNTVVYPHFIEQGKKLPIFEKSLDDKNSLTTWCIVNQKPVIINDIEFEHQQYVPELNVSSTTKTAYSRLHLPLTVNDKHIGIFVVNSFDRNAYSKDDVTNLQTLASYISIALDNANAYGLINQKNQAIRESINYAQSIQSAFMPTREQLNKFMDCFVLFKPKDVVSGDFTWFSPIERNPDKPLKAFICVADCTGHGVPGALVSMVGNNLLHEVINLREERNPAQVLELVNVGFQLALKQDETRNNDGMDMALILLEELETQSSMLKEGSSFEHSAASFQLTFSGAKNPCVIYRAQKGELEILKGARKSIGGLRAKRSKVFFDAHKTMLNKGDCVYLFTDGIIDQHDMNRERFTREKLMKLILRLAADDTKKQLTNFEEALVEHMQKEKQTDDISMIGIKI